MSIALIVCASFDTRFALPSLSADEAVGADALGKLLQLGFIEGAAEVGGRFVDGVYR